MSDDAEFRARLEETGPEQVRINLESGRHYNDRKAPIARLWLREHDAMPVAQRRQPDIVSHAHYRPTKGDLAYQQAENAEADLDPFEEAILLRKVSAAFLSVSISENTGPTCAPYRAMLDAEMARRGSMVAKRANQISIASFVIALASLVISFWA